MALVQLLNSPARALEPVKLEARPQRRIDLGAYSGARVVTTQRPSPKPSPVSTKIEVGSIVIEQQASGNLIIYTKHEPDKRLLIENADVEDLPVALDGVLGNRPSKLTK